MKKHLWTILLIIWISFIFLNSFQTGAQSSQASGIFTNFFTNLFLKIGWSVNQETLSMLIRKGAHMFEFFVLALLFCLQYFRKHPLQKTLEKALISSIVVAVVDELIQLSVPGRVGTIIDVTIDNVGIVFALVLF